jgi:hypothetical protein
MPKLIITEAEDLKKLARDSISSRGSRPIDIFFLKKDPL